MFATEFEFFIFRVIVFSVTTVLLAIAGKMTNTNLRYSNEYRKEHPNRIKKRWGIVCCLFLLGIVIGVYAIYELCTGNPNEFLGMKIVFYLLCWSLVVADFVVYDLPWGHHLEYFLSSFLGLAPFVGGGLLVAFFIYGGAIAPNFLPQTVVEREIVSKTDLVAANDGQRIDGEFHSGLFTATFTISEDGVYRYYYRVEDGGIKQDWVPADETTIYYSKNEESPHLDKIVSYTVVTHMRNNQPQETKRNETSWYELYVPEGSVVEAYVFDLQ